MESQVTRLREMSDLFLYMVCLRRLAKDKAQPAGSPLESKVIIFI